MEPFAVRVVKEVDLGPKIDHSGLSTSPPASQLIPFRPHPLSTIICWKLSISDHAEANPSFTQRLLHISMQRIGWHVIYKTYQNKIRKISKWQNIHKYSFRSVSCSIREPQKALIFQINTLMCI